MSEGGSSKKVNPWVSLTTGCISGGIECVAVWPMEFIKTQLQLQKVVAGVKPPYTGAVVIVPSSKYKGAQHLLSELTIDCRSHIRPRLHSENNWILESV